MAIYPLTITQLGPLGDGIHESPRGRVFVDRALPGDEVRAKVSQDADGVYRGEISQIVKPSEYRQVAPCPFYDQCGNCSLQHATDSFYRAWKLETVKQALLKYGVSAPTWLEPIFLGGHNRRRATFTALREGHKIVVGYYRRRSRILSDIDSCAIASPKLMELRSALKPFLVTLLKPGKAVDIFLQLVGDAVDLVFTGPINIKHDTLEALSVVCGITRISWRPTTEANLKTLYSQGNVTVEFHNLKVHLPAFAFLQPTLEGEKALVNEVRSVLPTKARSADLFAGCGTFSGALLSYGPVDAYESVNTAVMALSKAAGKMPLKVFQRDLFKKPLSPKECQNYDVIVFDPPRAGALAQATQLAKATTPLVIGISCQPATFARDASLLQQGGYRLKSLRVIDQFLWSHHVEVVGVFSKQ